MDIFSKTISIDEAEIRRRLKIVRTDFAEKFRAQRKRLRMSLGQLAGVFGVSLTTVSLWEKGKVNPYCGATMALQVVNELEPRENNSFSFGRGRPRKLGGERAENLKYRTEFKVERKRLNLSQAAVCKIFGVGRGAVYNWESGKCQPRHTWEYVLDVLRRTQV